MILKSSFVKNIKYLREQAGVSQKGLAEQVGVDVRTISLYENGKSFPKVDLLGKISLALDVPIEAFFSDDCEAFVQPREAVAFEAPPVTLPASGDLLDQVKAYRESLASLRQPALSGNIEAIAQLLGCLEQAIDSLETESIAKKEVAANLEYATKLLTKMMGGD